MSNEYEFLTLILHIKGMTMLKIVYTTLTENCFSFPQKKDTFMI